MRTGLVYLKVFSPSDQNAPPPEHYADWTRRFYETYEKFKGDVPHQLLVVNCGLSSGGRLDYSGRGWDVGAFQFANQVLQDELDFLIFMNTANHFWRPGFLERMVGARERYGPGMYGPSCSYEISPHIRTPCFAVDPKEFVQYPFKIVDRTGTFRSEAGDQNITAWYRSTGRPTLMIAADGNDYPLPEWRNPTNVFRRGDQTNCLVWDRHMDYYQAAPPEEKLQLERTADNPGLVLPK